MNSHTTRTRIAAIIAACAITGGLATACTPPEPKTDDTTQPETTQQDAAPAEAEQAADDDAGVPIEHRNALIQAKMYSDTMHMSKQGIYDQLVAEYGGKFPPESAQYAIDNVDADWNNNALETARVYQNEMALSVEDIRQQLSADYGDKFTEEEAQYAIDNL